MTMKMICIATILSVTAMASQASAGGILSSGKKGRVNVAPSISILNGADLRILSGVLNGNSILSGNKTNGGLLGLGILSNNNSNNDNRSYRVRNGRR